jgi:6,7-dimethyl-8-ribityllumazine synthase
MNELDLEMPVGRVRMGIAAARFNQFITDQLLEGVRDALQRHGVAEADITLAWVPGAFELPLAAEALLAGDHADAVIALGAVIRGGTPHFEYVAGACVDGLGEVALRHGKPVVFGVLTTETVEQALERASVDQGNKGFDAAMTAMQMLGLLQRLQPGDKSHG